MTVNVRHDWFWPFIVMLIGVGLGVILTGYQTRSKERDQSIIRLAALRQADQDDAHAGGCRGHPGPRKLGRGHSQPRSFLIAWDMRPPICFLHTPYQKK